MVQNGVELSMLSTTSSELQNSVSLSVYPIRMNTAYTLTVMVWKMINTEGNLNLHVKNSSIITD